MLERLLDRMVNHWRSTLLGALVVISMCYRMINNPEILADTSALLANADRLLSMVGGIGLMVAKDQ